MYSLKLSAVRSTFAEGDILRLKGYAVKNLEYDCFGMPLLQYYANALQV